MAYGFPPYTTSRVNSVSERAGTSLWSRVFTTIGELPIRGQDLSGVDSATRRSMREVGFVYLSIVAMASPLVIRLSLLGMREMVTFILTMFVLMLSNLVWMRRSHDPIKAGTIGSLLLFVTLMGGTMFTGGFDGPVISWLYVLPVSGALLVGPRMGGALTVMAIVATAVFWKLPSLGIELVNGLPLEQQNGQNIVSRVMALVGLGVLLTALNAQRRFSTVMLEEEMRKQRELRERANTVQRQAEHANDAKNRLLVNLSHELRTPLNTIVSYSEVLAEEQEEVDGPLSEDVGYILDAAVGLSNLFETLFFLTSLESGSLRVNLANVTVSAVLAELSKEFGEQAQHAGLALEFDCPQDLLLSTDPMLLRQILRGLLDNAIKFTDAGHVRCEVTSDGGDAVKIVVEDTGSGMSEEQVERALESFSQSNLFAQRVHDGLGLGLTLCAHLAGLLGAELSIDSKLYEGTSAHVRFGLDEA